MQTNLETLFNDLMTLCDAPESSFYFTEPVYNGKQYRVFTYRLASFTEFQQKNASECRGHTFRLDGDRWVLASLPMAKFWNYGEHIGWGNDIDLNSIDMIMDKADGSLISTVSDGEGNYFLKSKTSFTSSQAVDATELVKRDLELQSRLDYLVLRNYTVNMEYVSPNNQIVIGYTEPALIILNVRFNATGEYMPYNIVVGLFGDRVIKTIPVPADTSTFIADTEALTGIEGYVVKMQDGMCFKIKTLAYVAAHGLVSNLNSPKRVYELVLMEAVDDIIHIIKSNEYLMKIVEDETARIRSLYIHIEHTVNNFYNANKELSRKDYAILAQTNLPNHLMSLAMNLYIGRELNLKEFMLRKYDLFKSEVQEFLSREE